MRSPPPVFDWPITEEGEGSETRDGHGNSATSFGLGSPENPILVDLNSEEGDIESRPGFAQYPILIRDRDDTP
jgi:hypothetical protein